MSKQLFQEGLSSKNLKASLLLFAERSLPVGVNNGTTAIHLALLALGIKAGDEVIIPANTFIATAWGVSYTGATPVFVDCDAPHMGNRSCSG